MTSIVVEAEQCVPLKGQASRSMRARPTHRAGGSGPMGAKDQYQQLGPEHTAGVEFPPPPRGLLHERGDRRHERPGQMLGTLGRRRRFPGRPTDLGELDPTCVCVVVSGGCRWIGKQSCGGPERQPPPSAAPRESNNPLQASANHDPRS